MTTTSGSSWKGRGLKISERITQRTFSFDKYLNEVNKLPRISEEEEVVLSKRIKEGDENALNKLIESNLRFVISCAKQYMGVGISMEDLVNEGNIGLIKAAKQFDHTRGFKFISYAVWWIRQSIVSAITNNVRIVRIPTNRIKHLSSMQNDAIVMEQEDGFVDYDLIGHKYDMSPEVVKSLITGGYMESLDEISSNEKETKVTLLEAETIKSDLDHEDDSIVLNRILARIKPHEADIVKRLYGIHPYKSPQTKEYVGSCYGLGLERIRQIEKRAIRKLKKYSNIAIA